jgi:uncharacterized membrane-anchored protein YjiN (DUF445 family)
MVLPFVDRIGCDKAYVDRIDALKRDLLARPELSELARTIWSNSRSFIECSASGESRVLQHHLSLMFVAAGDALGGDAELRGEINQGLVVVLRSFIADQKSGVSTLISDPVKSRDMAQLLSLIEINIGRDLQYIRFNGSLIDGLAGLALYTAEFLLRLLCLASRHRLFPAEPVVAGPARRLNAQESPLASFLLRCGTISRRPRSPN